MRHEPQSERLRLVEQGLLPGFAPVTASDATQAQIKAERRDRRGAEPKQADLLAELDAERAQAEREATRNKERTAAQVVEAEAFARYGHAFPDLVIEHLRRHQGYCSELMVWRGVKAACVYEPCWGGRLNEHSFTFSNAHISVHVLDPAPAETRQTSPDGSREWVSHTSDALPITDTGYRSVFCRRQAVDAIGGPAAFVAAMCEEELAELAKPKKLRKRKY